MSLRPACPSSPGGSRRSPSSARYSLAVPGSPATKANVRFFNSTAWRNSHSVMLIPAAAGSARDGSVVPADDEQHPVRLVDPTLADRHRQLTIAALNLLFHRHLDELEPPFAVASHFPDHPGSFLAIVHQIGTRAADHDPIWGTFAAGQPSIWCATVSTPSARHGSIRLATRRRVAQSSIRRAVAASARSSSTRARSRRPRRREPRDAGGRRTARSTAARSGRALPT